MSPRWRRLDPNVRLFLCGEALLALGTGIGAVLLNLHWQRVGFSATAIGFLGALESGVVAILAIPAGAAADRLGRRRLLLASTLLIGAALALSTLPSWPAVVLARVVSALGWTALLTVEFPVAMRYGRGAQDHVLIFSLVIGVFTAFMGAGTLLGGLLPRWTAGAAAELKASPYQPPLLLAALLIGATSAVRARMDIPASQPGAAAPPPAPALPDPLILRLAVPSLLGGFAFGCVGPMLNLILADRYGVSAAVIGVVLTAQGFASALGSLAAPRLSARWGELRAVARSLLLSSALGVALAAPVGLGLFVALNWLRVALVSVGGNVAEGRMFSAVPDRRRALYAGCRTVGAQLGQTVASIAVGRLLDGGLAGVPFLLAGLAQAGYAAYYLRAVLPVLDGAAARPGRARAAVAE